MPSQSDAFITVKARLWNSTLVADYPRVDQVTIVSSIEISIPEIYNIQQLNGEDHGFVCLLLFPPFSVERNKIEFFFHVFCVLHRLLHVRIQICISSRAMDRFQFGL